MKKFSFKNYLSPFTWRYGSEEMRYIFSEEYKYKLWRKIWVSLIQSQYQLGLVSKKELTDLKKNQNKIDIKRILEIEKQTKHDLVAGIKEFAEKAKIGRGKIHLGATSMDIVDNADNLRIKIALEIIEKKLIKLLKLFGHQIKKYAYLPCMGYTHLQPAEPTTVGYRLAFYGQDLLTDFEYLQFIKKQVKAKGIKGAVGTSASYFSLVNHNQKKLKQLKDKFNKLLEIKPALITNQVYSRKYDFLVLSALQSIASTLAKFAGDLRILQSANFGEWSEPFSKKQVGSSAMPFKKNPISSEKICSLNRYINHLTPIALENATFSHLERTLDDSANKRLIISESFLALDEILITSQKIISGLIINKKKIKDNLEQYGPFASIEALLIKGVKNKANRQNLHEIFRKISLQAWQKINQNQPNPMKQLLLKNSQIKKYLTEKEINQLLDIKTHIGDAPQRALLLVKEIKKIL